MVTIVLVHPDIPGNTGSIGRTCVALKARLILIKPYGFSLDEKSLRRAGLDYWKHVDLTEYDDFDHFLEAEAPKRLCLFSKKAQKIYYQANFTQEDYLVFGSETQGLSHELLERHQETTYHLPQYSQKIRSLNLANCATAVAYEALRQIKVPGTF